MNNQIRDEEKTGIENAKVTKKLWRQKPILYTNKMLTSCKESPRFSVNGGNWKVNVERGATFRPLLHLPRESRPEGREANRIEECIWNANPRINSSGD